MEALVKITKRCLKAVVKYQLLHEDALDTLLIETESIVNSRPLISVSDDINDLEPLTPNHFLTGRSSPNTNFTNITEKNVNKTEISTSCHQYVLERLDKGIFTVTDITKLMDKTSREHEDQRHGYI